MPQWFAPSLGAGGRQDDSKFLTSATEAKRLYDVVARAGIKHALAATHRFDPSVTWLAELSRDGAIGKLVEVGFELRLSASALRPCMVVGRYGCHRGLFASPLPHVFGIL